MRLASEAFQKRSRKARFADTSPPGNEHHLTFAGLALGPAPKQQFEFFFPPDERSQAGRVQRLEPTFRRTRPQRCPGSHRSGNALEILWSEVLQLKEIAEKSSRGLGNDHHVRVCDPLQTRRQIRRLADNTTLLRLA